MRTTFFSLLALAMFQLPGCTQEKTHGEVVIVQGGLPVNACAVENSWRTADGAIVGHGLYHYLYSYYYVNDADFHLKARMSWEKLDSTTAIFMLFSNHFGFDAKADEEHEHGHFFFYSPGSKRLVRFGKATDVLQQGRPFDFEIVRRDTIFRFLVDSVTVATIPLSWLTPPYEGIVGFRPWLNTVHVYDWTLEGDLTYRRPPEFVFENGEAGYVCFREPAVVRTPEGNLLAFAVGRRLNCWSDAGDIDIVMKTSRDRGQTWGPLRVVWDDAENSCVQPTPIVDERTGKIVLLASRFAAGDDFKKFAAGKNKDHKRMYVLESADQGQSWSAPREITADIVAEGWWWFGVGPGAGIQLKNGPWAGRLVAGVHHIERENNGCYIGAVYSDDGGLSWRHGEPLLSLAGGNESVVAELPSGELLINARNRDHNAGANWENENFRIVARSRDGGRSWVEARRDTALVEPACHASLLAIENPGFPEGLLLFSNPPDSTYRENLSVRASLDGGRTWPWKRRLFEGPSAYSSLVDLGSGRAGCLFECGAAWAHEGIAFRMFDYAEALQ